MKLKTIFLSLILVLLIGVACETENTDVNTQLDDEALAMIEEEVLADINFSELLDEGDDGIFWGDAAFSMLKSGDVQNGTCPIRTVERGENKKTVTLDFTSGDCAKNGIIVIEYIKPGDQPFHKKIITYDGFENRHGVLFNGTKTILRSNGKYNVKAEITTVREKDDGKVITTIRDYNREVIWICGLDTRTREDNIKKVSGNTNVTRTLELPGEDPVEKTYSRQIVKPLLIVKACDLKVQAGKVKVERGDGTELIINYGKMPEDVDCVFSDCKTTFEVTKDGETYNMTLDENGRRVKQTD